MRRDLSTKLAAPLVALALVAGCTRPAPPRAKRAGPFVQRELALAREVPHELDLSLPAKLGVHTIYLDAGHGADKNPGNSSCFCLSEEDFTRDLALDVADYLEATNHFRVIVNRVSNEKVAYARRVSDAAAMRADAFVSLHSDVRGPGRPWSPSEGLECVQNTEAPGFVVIYSDEGAPQIVSARRALARDLSARMGEAGFLQYTSTYEGLYEVDAANHSVLVDRHAPDKRIFILRRTTMPTILVETHHALDPYEAALWEEPETRRAFAAALAQALADFFSAPSGGS